MQIIRTKTDVTTKCLGISSDEETGVGVMRPATPGKKKLRLQIGSMQAITKRLNMRNHGHVKISKL
jgi:hypothetical protein